MQRLYISPSELLETENDVTGTVKYSLSVYTVHIRLETDQSASQILQIYPDNTLRLGELGHRHKEDRVSVYFSLPGHVGGLVAGDEYVWEGVEDEWVGVGEGKTAESVGSCRRQVCPLQASLHRLQRVLGTTVT